MNIDFGKLLEILGPQIMALFGLALAQVILAVAVAIKNQVFEWKKLADFFGTIIIPRVLAWLACMIIVYLVPEKYLSQELSGGIQTVSFMAVVASFVGSIVANLRALGILSDSAVLDKVGLPAREDLKLPPK